MKTLTPHQKEFKLHVAVVKHIHSAYPTLEFIHIPNRPGDAADGFFKKMLGARAGASDLLFTWQDNGLHGGLIEIKVDKGRVTNDQNRFLSTWARLGWRVGVCRSVAEVHDTIKSWGIKPDHNGIMEPDMRDWDERVADGVAFSAP